MLDKNKTNTTENYDFQRQPDKSSLWNPAKREFLGRNITSWGKIVGFYLIFYLVLAIFVGTFFALFCKTLSSERPKYVMGESLIGTNPGLGLRPMPPIDDNTEIMQIHFTNSTASCTPWIQDLDEFLNFYQTWYTHVEKADCAKNAPEKDGQVCKVDIAKSFGPCNSGNDYGYLKMQPCIFLKLNKIFDWEPKYYERDDLPQSMPENLKTHIRDSGTEKIVWVSCEGKDLADIENIHELQYYTDHGHRGFNGNFYPFTNQEGYMQPLVAVQFVNVTKGVLINIECKAWAKNIIHDRVDRRGLVQFELMIGQEPEEVYSSNKDENSEEDA